MTSLDNNKPAACSEKENFSPSNGLGDNHWPEMGGGNAHTGLGDNHWPGKGVANPHTGLGDNHRPGMGGANPRPHTGLGDNHRPGMGGANLRPHTGLGDHHRPGMGGANLHTGLSDHRRPGMGGANPHTGLGDHHRLMVGGKHPPAASSFSGPACKKPRPWSIDQGDNRRTEMGVCRPMVKTSNSLRTGSDKGTAVGDNYGLGMGGSGQPGMGGSGQPGKGSTEELDMASDDELFSSLEMPMEEEEPSPVVLDSSPFVYLSTIEEEMKKNPTRKFLATIKVGLQNCNKLLFVFRLRYELRRIRTFFCHILIFFTKFRYKTTEI